MSRVSSVTAVSPATLERRPGWGGPFGQIPVRIETNDGIVGYGVSGGGIASLAIINEVLAPLLTGAELNTRSLWQMMFQATRPFGGRGLAVMAMSGLDIAFWDAAAKSTGMSMYEFLGGAGQPAAVPWYDTEPPRPLAPPFAESGVKLTVPPGHDAEQTRELVVWAQAQLGTTTPLMLDVGMRWDLAIAQEFLDSPEALSLAWLEEPLPADDLVDYALLRRDFGTPIAGGEHDYTTDSFVRIMDAQALDVVQPDVTWCGGMTTLLEVIELGRLHGVAVCPHRGGEAWALPAIAARVDAPLAEAPRPWLTSINGEHRATEAGLAVDTAPGFGVDLRDLDWSV